MPPIQHDDDAVLRALSRLESKVDTVDGKIDGVRGEVGHIRERTAVMESQLLGLRASVDGLDSRVRDLEQERPTLTSVTNLETRFAKMSEEIQELKTARSRQAGILVGISLVAGFIGYLLNLVVAAFHG